MRILKIVAVFALLAAPLGAQDHLRNRRDGFWMGLGLGGGSMGAACTTCNADRVNGAAGFLRLGGTFSQHFLMGADFAGWAMTVYNVDQKFDAGTVSLLWYPSRRGAYYLKLGVGGIRYINQNANSATETVDEAGALTAGAGYEFRVARNVSIGPYLNVYGSSTVKRKVNGAPAPLAGDLTRNMAQFGIGLTLH